MRKVKKVFAFHFKKKKDESQENLTIDLLIVKQIKMRELENYIFN